MAINTERLTLKMCKDVAKKLSLKGHSRMKKDELLHFLVDDVDICNFKVSLYDLAEMCNHFKVKKSDHFSEFPDLIWMLLSDEYYKNK